MTQAILKSPFLIVAFLLLGTLGIWAQVPTPVLPKQNVIVQNNVMLRWNKVVGATTYEVQYADNSAFTAAVSVTGIVDGFLALPVLTSGKYYYWRVRAQMPAGPTAWAQTWRFGIFTPTDFPSLVFWISGDGPVNVDIANRVTQWTDRSGQGNHVGQSNPAKQPLLVSNGLNGKPVVRFDGGDALSGGDILDLNDNSHTSVVLGKSNTTNAAYFAKSVAAAAVNRYAMFYETTRLKVLFHGSAAREASVVRTFGSAELLMGVIDRSSSVINLRVNGFNAGTPGTGINNATYNFNSTYRFLVGAYGDATDAGEVLYLNGDIAEMFFYHAAFPDSIRQIMEKYVMDKYYPPVNLGPDTLFAYGFCGYTANAGSGYSSYSWSGGGTAATKALTAPGTYSVTVTDIFGRVSADTIVVAMPNPSFVGSPVICLGGSTVWNTGLPTSNYSFSWSPPSGNTNAITITAPGTYRVTVTDVNNCTYVSPAVVFTVDSFVNKVGILSGPDTSLCSGNNIGLSRGSQLVATYAWSNGSTAPTTLVDTNGIYRVTVTNGNSCTASLSANVVITGSGPVANFAFDTVCLGMTTRFTDLSTVSPPFTVAGWQWSFGDSQGSTQQNPQHTYAATGTYSVTFTATADNGCISSPIVKQVLVRPSIMARFNDTLACLNAPALFFDASTVPVGDSLVSWYWDFGNSSFASVKNPQTVYSATGTFPVTLQIESKLGCKDTVSRNVQVGNTAPLPGSFDFLAPQPNGLNITTPNIVFQWQPAANGVRYKLEVSTNPNFTSPLVSTVVTQTSYTATNIPYSQNAHYYRVTAYNVCNDSIRSSSMVFYRFTPTLLGSSAKLWVMADGQLVKDGSNYVSSWIDQSGNSHNLNQQGSGQQPLWVDSVALLKYKPTLRFDGSDYLNGGNILSLGNKSWSFFVVGRMNAQNNTYFAKSVAAAAINRYGLIKDGNNLNLLLHDNIVVYEAKAPTPFGRYELVRGSLNRLAAFFELYRNSTLLAQTGGLSPSYSNNGNYRFLVGAYGNAADDNQVLYLDGNIAEIIAVDTQLTTLQIALLERYLYHKYSGPVWLGPDIKIAYGFCDSVVLDASERYQRYLWSTGDTTRRLKVTNSGTYWVEVTDVFDQKYYDTINVTLPSIALPTVNTICLGDSIVWDANLGPGYRYAWNTGDTTARLAIYNTGIYFVTIADMNNPSCSYMSDILTVRLDSFAITTTLGPDTTLCGGALISLRANANQAVAYNWSTGSNDAAIAINNSGTYVVDVLNTTGCQASDTINVTVSGRLANVAFASPNAFCLGDSSRFTNQSTISPPYNILDYRWSFGINGDTSHLPNPSYYYGTTGIYTVTLEVTSDSGCVARASKNVRVFEKPTAKFSYQIGCAGAPLSFADQSVGVANDALTTWFWEFGDNTTSTLRNPTHVYAQPGIYEVKLNIASATGCTSTFIDTLEVFPELVVIIGADNLCFGETTQFTDASPGYSNIAWEWEFGDASFSTQRNPTHNYTQTGNFLVRLTVRNALGCRASVLDTISIVQPPAANFIYDVACQDRNFRLASTSTPAGNDSIVKWRWTFNDGGPVSNAPNPVRTYNTTGTFPVTLYVESSNGCPASVTKSVIIAPAPVASFTFTPDYGAAPLPVTYTNTSVGAIAYQWYFGDGGYSQDTNPVHTFEYNSDFATTLVAIGPGGCKDTFGSSLTVNIASLDIAVVDVNVQNVNGRVRPMATVINQGTRNVGHYYLTASLGDGSRITERIDTFLASGTGMTHTFTAGYEATAFQASSFLCVVASMPNEEIDDNPLNDRLCAPLENDIRIVPPHPNPTRDFVTFEVIVPREEQLEIRMFDVMGHKLMDIYNGMAAEGTQTYRLDMNAYPQGVYILRIKFKDDEYIYKFVTQ